MTMDKTVRYSQKIYAKFILKGVDTDLLAKISTK